MAPRLAPRALPAVAGGVIVVMFAVHVAAGYGTSGVPDLHRDLYWAHEILAGAWPLRGPVIYNTFELGPWWYYVVAAALWATGSLAGTAALVSALAAIKYPLAWRLGRKLGGNALGLAFVLALSVPGWSAVPLGFTTHTALVEAALLTLALVTLAWRERPGWYSAIGFGFAAALCAHAHPTTVLFVAIAGFAVLARHRDARTIVGLALAAAIALASLAPPLVAADSDVSSVGAAFAHYAAHDVGVDPFTRALRIAASVAAGGAWHGMLLLTEVPRGEWLGLGIALLALASAAAGWMMAWRHDERSWTLARIGLALFAVQCAFVVLIRPITPIWMTSALMPPFAFALACGWRALARSRPGATLAAFAAAGWFGASLAIHAYFVREIDTVRIADRGNVFMDAGLAWSTGWTEARVARVRLRRLERAARAACGGATLHGDLAIADELALGLPTRRACGDAVDVRYGGTDPARGHLAGYVLRSWCAVGLRPESSASGFGFTRRVVPLVPEAGARRARLSPRQIDPLPAPLEAGSLSLRVRAPSDGVLALGHKYGWLHDLSITRVATHGGHARLVHQDVATRYYRCDGCRGGSVEWTIEGRGHPSGIDLVALRGAPDGVDACELLEPP